MTDRNQLGGSLPRSIAIAGAWGYIGRKFIDAARLLGVETFVYDPGRRPVDLPGIPLQHITDERQFYQLPADLFHLAVHPEHRQLGMETLLQRSRTERIVVLNEKPMAAPDCPEQCDNIVLAVDRSKIVMLYDFPELYDPLTARIVEILSAFRDLRIDEIRVCRSKDREDRSNPRNQKRMVTIQYQETVHCLAFVLNLLGHIHGGLDQTLAQGLSVRAKAQPYDPPNPAAYPHVVDGRCEYELNLGKIRIEGLTDFKLGASWAKTRVIRGMGDGRPFLIEADFLEGKKRLIVDGVPQAWDPNSNSYEHVIRTLWQWQQLSHGNLMRGLHPNPDFARATYQLSSAVWRSCHDDGEIRLPTMDALLAFDAGYGEAVVGFPQYPGGEPN